MFLRYPPVKEAMGEQKYYSVGSNPVGNPKIITIFPNVFYSFADADYFIRNMRKYVKNFHYFVEACDVKECAKCRGSGIVRTLLELRGPGMHDLEACDNCHGHGVVKA